MSTAVTDPVPAMVACIDTSIGTGAMRPLKVFDDCAVGSAMPTQKKSGNSSHFI